MPQSAPDPNVVGAPPGQRNANWVPTRKAVSAGIGGILAGLIATAAAKFGYPIPSDLLPYLAGGIMWLIFYLVPASKQDVVRNLDNEIVAMAEADPKSPVSVPGIAQAIGEAKVAAADAKAVSIDPNEGNFQSGPR